MQDLSHINDDILTVMTGLNPNATYLADGSGRVVFIDRELDVVYKVAQSENGLRQNTQEYQCFTEYPDVVPTIHKTLTINDQAHVVLVSDIAYAYEDYIRDAYETLTTFANEHTHDASLETVRDVINTLNVYPFDEKHPSDPERLYLTQLKEYVDGMDVNELDNEIDYDDVDEIATSDLIVLLEETYRTADFAQIISINEVNQYNIGFKAMPDGSFMPKVIDAGINYWSSFSGIPDEINSENTIEYY